MSKQNIGQRALQALPEVPSAFSPQIVPVQPMPTTEAISEQLERLSNQTWRNINSSNGIIGNGPGTMGVGNLNCVNIGQKQSREGMNNDNDKDKDNSTIASSVNNVELVAGNDSNRDKNKNKNAIKNNNNSRNNGKNTNINGNENGNGNEMQNGNNKNIGNIGVNPQLQYYGLYPYQYQYLNSQQLTAPPQARSQAGSQATAQASGQVSAASLPHALFENVSFLQSRSNSRNNSLGSPTGAKGVTGATNTPEEQLAMVNMQLQFLLQRQLMLQQQLGLANGNEKNVNLNHAQMQMQQWQHSFNRRNGFGSVWQSLSQQLQYQLIENDEKLKQTRPYGKKNSRKNRILINGRTTTNKNNKKTKSNSKTKNNYQGKSKSSSNNSMRNLANARHNNNVKNPRKTSMSFPPSDKTVSNNLATQSSNNFNCLSNQENMEDDMDVSMSMNRLGDGDGDNDSIGLQQNLNLNLNIKPIRKRRRNNKRGRGNEQLQVNRNKNKHNCKKENGVIDLCDDNDDSESKNKNKNKNENENEIQTISNFNFYNSSQSWDVYAPKRKRQRLQVPPSASAAPLMGTNETIAIDEDDEFDELNEQTNVDLNVNVNENDNEKDNENQSVCINIIQSNINDNMKTSKSGDKTSKRKSRNRKGKSRSRSKSIKEKSITISKPRDKSKKSCKSNSKRTSDKDGGKKKRGRGRARGRTRGRARGRPCGNSGDISEILGVADVSDVSSNDSDLFESESLLSIQSDDSFEPFESIMFDNSIKHFYNNIDKYGDNYKKNKNTNMNTNGNKMFNSDNNNNNNNNGYTIGDPRRIEYQDDMSRCIEKLRRKRRNKINKIEIEKKKKSVNTRRYWTKEYVCQLCKTRFEQREQREQHQHEKEEQEGKESGGKKNKIVKRKGQGKGKGKGKGKNSIVDAKRYTFTSNQDWYIHEMTSHNIGIKIEFDCPLCQESYLERRWLNRHLRQKHKIEPSDITDPAYADIINGSTKSDSNSTTVSPSVDNKSKNFKKATVNGDDSNSIDDIERELEMDIEMAIKSMSKNSGHGKGEDEICSDDYD